MCLADPFPSIFEDDTEKSIVVFDAHCVGRNNTLQMPAVQEDAEILEDSTLLQSALVVM